MRSASHNGCSSLVSASLGRPDNKCAWKKQHLSQGFISSGNEPTVLTQFDSMCARTVFGKPSRRQKERISVASFVPVYSTSMAVGTACPLTFFDKEMTNFCTCPEVQSIAIWWIVDNINTAADLEVVWTTQIASSLTGSAPGSSPLCYLWFSVICSKERGGWWGNQLINSHWLPKSWLTETFSPLFPSDPEKTRQQLSRLDAPLSQAALLSSLLSLQQQTEDKVRLIISLSSIGFVEADTQVVTSLSLHIELHFYQLEAQKVRNSWRRKIQINRN